MLRILSRYPKSIAQYNFEYLCSHIENYWKTSVKNCEYYSIKTATISNIQYEQLYKLGRLYGKSQTFKWISHMKLTNKV